MAFKASEKVEPLDYDLEPYGPKGTVPEPSSKEIEKFQRDVFEIFKGSGIDIAALQRGEIDLEQVDGLLKTASDLNVMLVVAVADITKIPYSTLDELPYRFKTAFVGWVIGEFLNPQPSAPGTTPSAAAVAGV